MVVDFAKVSVQEQPLLILQNLDDTPIGVLKAAFNVEADLCYNEISTLRFDLPAFINGEDTANYKQTVGMRIVELKNYGRFILVDPQIADDGIKQVKACTAYSLEYEFTFKKLPLAAGTYNFWNPFASNGTILGLILEQMPSWRVGQVDSALIDRYRTFDDSGEQNIYNFMKSALQESYGCIFYFDTYERLIHVRDINTQAPLKPVYFSMENLVKSVAIDEDTEGIITKLNVYGADGVDIRSVNPMGTSSIIELGYFMTLENFSQSIIDKYNNWKQTFEAYQRPYFNLTVEEALKTAQLVTEQAALVTLQSELTSLENIQAVTIQAIAQGLKSQSDLNKVNSQIVSKKSEISSKEQELTSIQAQVDDLNSQMLAINKKTSFESFFTTAEYKILNRYLKEDSISEDSFVVPEVDTYDAAGESVKLSGSIFNITSSNVVLAKNTDGKDIYSASGGSLACSATGFKLDAVLIRASLDYTTNGEFLFTARMNAGTLNGEEFPSACISIAGTASAVSSNATPNSSVHGAISEGTSISFKLGTANLYFTRSTTEYEQRAVEWDLFDYGVELLQKLAWPSYTFSLDLANFMVLSEFAPFKSNLELGSKLYFKQRDGQVLKPILVGVHIPFEDLTKFSVELSSKYNSNLCEFTYNDIYEEAKSMGTTLDSGKWTYNQFVNSGAETSLSKIVKSALDIAKNNIISSAGQAITWDQAGFRLRKRRDGSETEFEPYQIWMNNSSIMFTTDNWSTANLAIGQIVSESGNILSGVIADSLIGKLLAGNSLIIESEKSDGGVSVFRVDGSGASLHNASFNLYGSSGGRIDLGAIFGIVAGSDKNTLFYYNSKGQPTGVRTSNNRSIASIDSLQSGEQPNANFWLDMKGDAYFRGKIKAMAGGYIGGFTIEDDYLHAGSGSNYVAINGSGSNANSLYAFWAGNATAASAPFWVKKNGDVFMNSGTFKGTLSAAKIKGNLTADSSGGWLRGCGISVGGSDYATGIGNFYVDSSGNVTMKGSISLTGNITWGVGNSPCQVLYARAAYSTPSGKYSSFYSNASYWWHKTFDPYNDYYASYTYDGGNSWTSAIQIRGIDGENGEDGRNGSDATVTRDNIWRAMLNATWQDGIYATRDDWGDPVLLIRASAIKTGVIDARHVYLEGDYGGFCQGEGDDGTGPTTGAKIYGSDSRYYLIATNAGVRMTARSKDIFVTNNGCYSSEEFTRSSDRRVKNSVIYDMDKYGQFFMKLQPTAFRLNNGDSGRYHIGFIAQDVEQALLSAGLSTGDFAGFVRSSGQNDVHGEYADQCYLRYDNFIALNTHMIQSAWREIEALKKELAAIKEGKNG